MIIDRETVDTAELAIEVAAALRKLYPQQFDRLKSCLIPGGADTGYRALAEDLGMTEGALKVAVHRLRRRFRDLLREEIADTVDDPGQVKDELAVLLVALRL